MGSVVLDRKRTVLDFSLVLVQCVAYVLGVGPSLLALVQGRPRRVQGVDAGEASHFELEGSGTRQND